MKRVLFVILLVLAALGDRYAYAISFTYDRLNRLTGVTYDDGISLTFAYDATGNLTLNKKTVNQALLVNGVCGSAHGGNFDAAPSGNLCSAGSASLVVGSGPWHWLCQGVQGGQSAECTATVNEIPHALAIVLAGTGFGSVHSLSPAGLQLACTSSCSAMVAYGTQVTLSATESGGSSFTSWSACDSATDDLCSLAMNGDRNPVATFTLQQNLRIGSKNFGTLQSAFGEVGQNQSILARNMLLPNTGTAIFNRSGVRAFLKGGYDASFSVPGSGYSSYSGVLTIRSGTLVVEKFRVR